MVYAVAASYQHPTAYVSDGDGMPFFGFPGLHQLYRDACATREGNGVVGTMRAAAKTWQGTGSFDYTPADVSTFAANMTRANPGIEDDPCFRTFCRVSLLRSRIL